MLVDVDAEQARTLFGKSWEAAETADRESQKRLNISGGVVKLKPADITPETISSIVMSLDLRREVLKLAARRDRRLAEEFLRKLTADRQETKSENSKKKRVGPSRRTAAKIDSGRRTAAHGDIERALQFADLCL